MDEAADVLCVPVHAEPDGEGRAGELEWEESTGGRLRRSTQERFDRWASRSPWRPVYLCLGVVALGVAFILTPSTFASPGRGSLSVEWVGWACVALFAPTAVALAVHASRSRMSG